MRNLSRLLSPLSPEEFFANYWGARNLYLKGEPEKFGPIMTLESFERGVCDFAPFLGYPRVTMYSEGHILHESRFTLGKQVRISGALGQREEALVDLEKVRALLARGATLKVSEAECILPELVGLVGGLSDELEELVHVNTYYSSPGVSTFSPHFDKHDVFILQIHGAKLWQIFDCREPFPIPGLRKRRSEAFRDSAVTEINLTAGDLLYLPRGVWHHANTVDDHSLHITIGVDCATSIELLAWLVDRLSDNEDLRRNLPRKDLPTSLKSRLPDLVRDLLEAPGVVSTFRNERRARKRVGTRPRLLPEI